MQRKPENWKPSGIQDTSLTVRCRDGKTKIGRYSWAECWHLQDPTAEEVHHLGQRLLLFYYISRPLARLSPLALRSRRKRLNYLLHTADTTPHPIQSSSRARDGVPRLFPSGLCSTQRYLGEQIHSGSEHIPASSMHTVVS